MAQVSLDCGPAHEQACCDLRVGQTLGDEGDNLRFGRGEAVPAVPWTFALTVGAVHVLRGLRVTHCPALGFGCRGCLITEPAAGRSDGIVDGLLFVAEPPPV